MFLGMVDSMLVTSMRTHPRDTHPCHLHPCSLLLQDPAGCDSLQPSATVHSHHLHHTMSILSQEAPGSLLTCSFSPGIYPWGHPKVMLPAMRMTECIQPAAGELAVLVEFESMEVTAFEEISPSPSSYSVPALLSS